jgi:hypothetical protein
MGRLDRLRRAPRRKAARMSRRKPANGDEPAGLRIAPGGDPTLRFDVRVAWKRGDSAIQADAVAFWKRLGILPPDVDPQDRAGELIAGAYQGDRLVAVATATTEWIEPLRARLAVIRGATDPDFRRSRAQLALAEPSRAALVDWSLAHPEERLAGGIVFVERAEWGDFCRVPVWPGSRLGLAGYDDLDRQVRVSWFEHFRFDAQAAPRPLPRMPALTDDIELRPAWRGQDPRVEADAIAFWKRLRLLPADVTPEARAREIVVAAYRGDRIVAVVTAELGVLAQVRARLAMIRGAVDPGERRSHVGFAMLLAARGILERWSAENPDERIAGMGGIIESPDLIAAQGQPYWPVSRMGVIGFTPDGRQIRVSWFEDFRLD